MSLQQIADKVANYQIGLSWPLVNDATRQDFRCGVPLNVDGTATIFGSAPQFGPPGGTAGLSLKQELKIMCFQFSVIRDRITNAWPRSADYLDKCLQLGPQRCGDQPNVATTDPPSAAFPDTMERDPL